MYSASYTRNVTTLAEAINSVGTCNKLILTMTILAILTIIPFIGAICSLISLIIGLAVLIMVFLTLSKLSKVDREYRACKITYIISLVLVPLSIVYLIFVIVTMPETLSAFVYISHSITSIPSEVLLGIFTTHLLTPIALLIVGSILARVSYGLALFKLGRRHGDSCLKISGILYMIPDPIMIITLVASILGIIGTGHIKDKLKIAYLPPIHPLQYPQHPHYIPQPPTPAPPHRPYQQPTTRELVSKGESRIPQPYVPLPSPSPSPVMGGTEPREQRREEVKEEDTQVYAISASGREIEVGRYVRGEETLYMLLDPNTGLKINIIEGEVILGRYDFQKLYKDEAMYISREHLAVKFEGGKIFVKDLGSKNGTYVNGVDIRGRGWVEVKPGDKINIAKVLTLEVVKA